MQVYESSLNDDTYNKLPFEMQQCLLCFPPNVAQAAHQAEKTAFDKHQQAKIKAGFPSPKKDDFSPN